MGLGGLTAGCGGSDEGDQPLDRPLRMHHDASIGPLFAPYIKHYNDTYPPPKLDTSYVPQDYFGTTQTQLAGGSVDYDVLFADQGYSQKWYEAGFIRSLDDLDGVDEILETMPPKIVNTLRANDGKLVTLPYFQGVEFFAYNAEHLEQANSEVPQTWDEFVEVCRKIKKDGIAATPYSPFLVQDFPAMILLELSAEAFSDGAEPFFDDNLKPQFADDPVVQGVVERWRTLYEEGIIPADIFTSPYGNVVNVFAGGRSSFSVRYGPQLKGWNDPKQSKVADAVRNAPLPGKTQQSVNFGGTWMMTQSTPAPDDAWRVLRYLAAKDRSGEYYVPTNLIAIDLGLQTPYEKVNNDPKVRESWSKWADVPVLLEQIANSRNHGPAVNQSWFVDFQKGVGAEIQDAVRGKKSVNEALKSAANLVTSS
jgi:multiple sugar transport system substrate-binding protein